MTADSFLDVTEIEGQSISQEQLERTCHRYHWLAEEATNRDVLEIACGSGLGLGLVAKSAKSLVAGDISDKLVAIAKSKYGDEVKISRLDATHLTFADNSFDCIAIFEALYYLNDHKKLFSQIRRILRPNGILLITTANKDLFDFTPSPFSTKYLGAVELNHELSESGFGVELSGFHDVSKTSLRQKLLRPAKMLASWLGIIPKTMGGKAMLKRFYFGELIAMPPRIDYVPFTYKPATPIDTRVPDRKHKIIYCRAVSNKKG